MPKHPWELSFDDFIGPHMVSPVFAVDGRDEDWDWIWEDEALFIGSLSSPIWTSECGQYKVREMDSDTGAIQFFAVHKDNAVAGFHVDGVNWVDEPHRGRALAVEMTILAAERLGGSPTARHGETGFSPAGVGVMRKAHGLIVERALAHGLPVPEHVKDEYNLLPTSRF